MVSKQFLFCWGEPFCVREALKHYYKRSMTKPVNIDELQYCLDDGNEDLINLTRWFIKETTGIEYKYIVITNGTTGAINVALRVMAKEGKKNCYTHKYHFPYYPAIIEKNNYKHKIGLYRNHEKQLNSSSAVGLVDSPSNPAGDLLLYSDHKNNIIWDSVYHNPVYVNTIPVIPDHRVNCGSYSKVFGLTGVRVGWIATNSQEDYEAFRDENLYELCTVSVPSQELLLDIFDNMDLNNFMRSAKYRVNNNREMWDRIKGLFDNQEVPENGMFYPAWADPIAYKLLDKLGFTYVEMDNKGKDKYLRFNLAQTNDITNQAVRYLIKETRV
jgi:aspartate/methionine/tyrosine aminotransferase